jgi:hypothetical protein
MIRLIYDFIDFKYIKNKDLELLIIIKKTFIGQFLFITKIIY